MATKANKTVKVEDNKEVKNSVDNFDAQELLQIVGGFSRANQHINFAKQQIVC